MENNACANSFTAFSKASVAGLASVTLVAVVAVALAPAATAAGGEVASVVLAVTAALLVVEVADVAGVDAGVVVGLTAVWPMPSALKAAIMALTKVSSRNRGRSSSSRSTRRGVVAGLVVVANVAAAGEVAGTGNALAT